jgi:hypothetical protein
MVDLRISEQEKKENSVESVLEKPNYPYGLRIHIDPETYEKLGLKDCQVGEKMNLSGVGVVMSVNAEEVSGDEKEYSISVQITDLQLEKEKKEKSAESIIYGE